MLVVPNDFIHILKEVNRMLVIWIELDSGSGIPIGKWLSVGVVVSGSQPLFVIKACTKDSDGIRL